MVSEEFNSSNGWSVVSERFVPCNYEEYCAFMESHMIEIQGSFLIPWPVEGGFEYWIHEESTVDSLTSKVSFVSVVVPETSIYEENDAEVEGDQSMNQELNITCECLNSSQFLILTHRDELEEKSLKLPDSISNREFSFVVHSFKLNDKYENQQVCVNNSMSKKIDEMVSVHDMFDKMSKKKPPFSWYVFDPGIPLLLFLVTGGKDVSGKGVGTALAISNPIINRYTAVFVELWRLEPLAPLKTNFAGIHLENLNETDVYREDGEHVNPKEISDLDFQDTRLKFYSIVEPWNSYCYEFLVHYVYHNNSMGKGLVYLIEILQRSTPIKNLNFSSQLKLLLETCIDEWLVAWKLVMMWRMDYIAKGKYWASNNNWQEDFFQWCYVGHEDGKKMDSYAIDWESWRDGFYESSVFGNFHRILVCLKFFYMAATVMEIHEVRVDFECDQSRVWLIVWLPNMVFVKKMLFWLKTLLKGCEIVTYLVNIRRNVRNILVLVAAVAHFHCRGIYALLGCCIIAVFGVELFVVV